MKVYRYGYENIHEGRVIQWARSRKEAERELALLHRQHYAAGGPADYDEQGERVYGPRFDNIDEAPTVVDVPTDKAGLVAWLNANLNCDNG